MNEISITVRLFGELRQYAPAGIQSRRSFPHSIPSGTTILQLILRLGIPIGEHEGPIVAVLNDVEADLGSVIPAGAVLGLFEPLAGG